MDEYDTNPRGRRYGGRRPDREADGRSEQEYSWGGGPGEDFGPVTPPPPGPQGRPETAWPGGEPDLEATTRTPASTRWPPPPPVSSRLVRPRHSSRGPLLTLAAVLVVLAGMVGAVLFVLSRQDTTSDGSAATPGALAAASPAASPSVTAAAASATPAAPAAASPAAASPVAADPATAVPPTQPPAASPAASATPTARPSPTVAPTRTPRASPVVIPTLPSLIAPPGNRFATSTPARVGGTRTPPPVPTPRPASANTPLRVDRNTYQTGEDATVCAQATHGSSAQIGVLWPDGTMRTLGEFQPPADRVCHTFKLESPGLYVLTLVVKEASGRELERHATVIAASR